MFDKIIEDLEKTLQKVEAMYDSATEENERETISLAYCFVEKSLIEIKKNKSKKCNEYNLSRKVIMSELSRSRSR